MKQVFIISILLFISSMSTQCSKDDNPASSDNTTIQDSTKIEGFDLVWSDEFNTDGAPDDSKWDYDIGGGGWGNDEAQFYTSDSQNVRIENGNLVLESHYYDYNDDVPYTSARIVTRNKGDWLYGKIMVKARIPAGVGTWPAIWMLPTDWVYGGWPKSGEIDIMEHVGYDQNVIHGTVHTEAYNHKIGTQKGEQITIPTASTEFHIYSIEWDADKIDFFVDDQKYFSFANENKSSAEWPFDKRFHLIMNIAIGGGWGGVQGIDNTIFPVRMEVDYVRVYQKSN